MKTFREYLTESLFDNIWAAIVEYFSESEQLRAVYAEYCGKLIALPPKPLKGVIVLENDITSYPEGLNGAPDWLIDKKVKTTLTDGAVVAAALLYWASLHSFYTSEEHDADLSEYLDILDSEDPMALGRYISAAMQSKPVQAEIEESRERKERLFWEKTYSCLYAGDWRHTLYILKRKLEYDMGFMRGFADHAGRERDAERMQLCCNLIDGATARMYPDEQGRRALHLLFKILEQNITRWCD